MFSEWFFQLHASSCSGFFSLLVSCLIVCPSLLHFPCLYFPVLALEFDFLYMHNMTNDSCSFVVFYSYRLCLFQTSLNVLVGVLVLFCESFYSLKTSRTPSILLGVAYCNSVFKFTYFALQCSLLCVSLRLSSYVQKRYRPLRDMTIAGQPRCPVWCWLVTVPTDPDTTFTWPTCPFLSESAKCSQNGGTVLPIANLMVESESGSPSFYSHFIVTVGLSVLLSFGDVRIWQTDNADHYYSWPPRCGGQLITPDVNCGEVLSAAVLFHCAVSEKLSENINIVANEPSLAFYRIQEHVHKTMPPLVDKKVYLVVTCYTRLMFSLGWLPAKKHVSFLTKITLCTFFIWNLCSCAQVRAM